MSIPTLTLQHTAAGLNPNWQPASPGGDFYGNRGAETLNVRNLGPNPLAVTVIAQNKCNQSVLHPVTYVIPAAGAQPALILLGPLGFQFYDDASGNANILYSTTTLAPPGAPGAYLSIDSALGIGTYRYAITFVNGSGETTGGTEISIATTAGNQGVNLVGIPAGPVGTTKRGIYRTALGGGLGTEKLVWYLADNVTTSFLDTIPDFMLGAAIPTANTAAVPPPGAATVAAGAAGNPNGTYRCAVTFVNAAGETLGGVDALISVTNQQINWSNIPIGPAGTTARKLYRTSTVATGDTATLTESATVNSTTKTSTDTPPAVSTQGVPGTEKLVATLNDNTTTSFVDNVADAALGALIPAINTANVVQVAVTAA